MLKRVMAYLGLGSHKPPYAQTEASGQKPEAHIPGMARGQAAGIGAMQSADAPRSETERALRRAAEAKGEPRS